MEENNIKKLRYQMAITVKGNVLNYDAVIELLPPDNISADIRFADGKLLTMTGLYVDELKRYEWTPDPGTERSELCEAIGTMIETGMAFHSEHPFKSKY